ncbi:HlyD family efflux transporter periplasmic adaptor subunit [Microvirga sp. W0021]|uniref:HlyD family efflux transporter periplasmic adaptor subunit n=1 Tax=Hohaiivirga grylli TaxID=3133970 RepID=A0ABV0BFS7_9HYPH
MMFRLGKDKKFQRIPLIAGAVILAIALLVWLQGWQFGSQTAFQGYVEGNFVYVAPETAGRIVALEVEEGSDTQQGQSAFILNTDIEKAQRDEAEAKRAQAQAQLDDLRAAQQRPEQIAVLKAQEDQAKAQRDLAQAELDRQTKLFQKGYASKAALDQAQTTYDRSVAAFEEAQRQITASELAARTATIAAAEAGVKAAEAGLVQAQTALDKRTVYIPQNGRVQDVFFRVGEVVNAGQPVLSILPPQNMKYRFYVAETALAKFSLGQEVAIVCDACPDNLKAKISFISKDAEFTPPVIFSDEERAKLVFKVEALPVVPVELPVGLPIKAHTVE